MKSAIIHDLLDWRVSSYGNGLSYAILHRPSNRYLFFEGDDAETYRTQFQQLTEGVPCLDFADALAVIWADYSAIVL